MMELNKPQTSHIIYHYPVLGLECIPVRKNILNIETLFKKKKKKENIKTEQAYF